MFHCDQNDPLDPYFGIATNQYRCFYVFLPSKMTDSIAPGRCGRPKPVVLFLIQFLLVSKVHYEKQAVNRLSICIVFIVSMSQKQLIETTSPTIDLPNLFLKWIFVTLWTTENQGASDFFHSVAASVTDHFLDPPPPPPSLGITEEGAISRSARAITLASNVLHAQPRACWRDLCKGYLVV